MAEQELIKQWIDGLRTTDELRVQIAIEEMVEYLSNCDNIVQKYYLNKMLDSIYSEKSENLIKNVFSSIIVFQNKIEKKIINISDIFPFKDEPKFIKGIFSLFDNTNELEYLVKNYLNSLNSEIQNIAIEIVGQKKFTEFFLDLEKLFDESLEILRKHTKLLSYSTSKILGRKHKSNLDSKIESFENFINIEETIKIESDLPEIIEYNKELEDYYKNYEIKLKYHRIFSHKNSLIISIKRNMILKVLKKIFLIIRVLFNSNYPNLLIKIQEIVLNLIIIKDSRDLELVEQNSRSWTISESLKNYFLHKEHDWFIFKKLRNICYQYIGRFGDEKSIRLLYDMYNLEVDEDVIISIIQALGNLKFENSFNILREIAQDDKRLFYVVTSMLKIDKEKTKDYVVEQIYGGSVRRVLLSSLFIPYLDGEIFDKITRELLEFKQPLIIRQALYIIKRKHLYQEIPQVVNFIFSENDEVRNDAYSVLLEFGDQSLEFLGKRYNYYGDEKKGIISDLIARIQASDDYSKEDLIS